MALTVSENGTRRPDGRYWRRRYTVTGDSSYPTGGEPLTASILGVQSIVDVIPGVMSNSDHSLGLPLKWDKTNGKLVVYESGADGSPLDEDANGTDLSGYKAEIEVICV